MEMIDPEYQTTYDQLDTVRNFCELAQMVIFCERYHLLPTILEAMQLDQQELLSRHCVNPDS